MKMRPIVIGLVDRTQKNKRPEREIDDAVVAFNIQVTQHLRKCWSTVPPVIIRRLDMDNPESGQPGVWPIILVDANVLKQDEGGFHSTAHHRPYAKVAVRGEDWTIAASHETLEMVMDPCGNQLLAGPAIKCVAGEIEDDSSESEYLLEICDPCASSKFAYRINGKTWVSDFVTPDFYSCGGVPDGRYSFRHNILKPRHVLEGGYISWIINNNGTVFVEQISYLGRYPEQTGPERVDLNPQNPNLRNLRAFVDSKHSSKMRDAPAAVYNEDKYSPIYEMMPNGSPQTRDKAKAIDWTKSPHWVTYHHDGVIEREICTDAGKKVTCIEMVKAHEPIWRPKGCRHKIKNLGCGPIALDKDLIEPQ
jgi:hypothetical protein